MGDLDAELALFEQELEALEADPAQDESEAQKQEASNIGPQPVVPKEGRRNVYASKPVVLKGPEIDVTFNPPAPLLYGGGAEQQYPDPVPAPAAMAAAQEAAAIQMSKHTGHAITQQKQKRYIREAGGEKWEDPTLADWPEGDFRIFVGDLGNECDDATLGRAFSKYSSFQKCKVIRDKKTNKSKGFGFVSFADSGDMSRALREMNGKYVGNRPVKLRKSEWSDRNVSAKEARKFKRNRHC